MAIMALLMKLPFLKTRRIPRIATEPTEEKLVNGSQDNVMNDHFLHEMMDACEAKDVKLFRQSLESLIVNMFDYDGDENNED
jgi:hypothetical protein